MLKPTSQIGERTVWGLMWLSMFLATWLWSTLTQGEPKCPGAQGPMPGCCLHLEQVLPAGSWPQGCSGLYPACPKACISTRSFQMGLLFRL